MNRPIRSSHSQGVCVVYDLLLMGLDARNLLQLKVS